MIHWLMMRRASFFLIDLRSLWLKAWASVMGGAVEVEPSDLIGRMLI